MGAARRGAAAGVPAPAAPPLMRSLSRWLPLCARARLLWSQCQLGLCPRFLKRQAAC